MTQISDTAPPSTFPPSALISVDRAMGELRRGGIVVLRAATTVRDRYDHALVAAAEAIDETLLGRLADEGATAPMVLVTGRRAAVLGLADTQRQVVVVNSVAGPLSVRQVGAVADPLNDEKPEGVALAKDTPAWARPAVLLTKLGRLLPAAVAVPVPRPPEDLFVVDADAIMGYQQMAARSLTRISEARVPLLGAENARVIAFRPADGGIEHLAIVIGEPKGDQPVLARLHSECFTGDILGSLRCDCGDQLRGAIAEISRAGSGVLLYLAQEGRGIGLVNKLRAYQLQDAGFDTLDANLQLGFDDDERIYLPAAEMLRRLGLHQVRLLTNNPAKVEGLARHGIDVVERVAHVFPSNDHNMFYLKTKATRSGHLF